MINFYNNKSKTLPRFFYRNFFNQIKKNNLSDEKAIKIFTELLNNTKGSDFIKFTWNIPTYFKKNFNEELIKELKSLLKKKRDNKSDKLKKSIYPHVSDEFSLSNEFLSSVFDINNFPKIDKKDIFFSFGSCFAQNFTIFLNSKNIHAKNYSQFEDLNSPGSNAALINCLNLSKKNLYDYIKTNIDIFWSENSKNEKKNIEDQKIEEIFNLKNNILESNKLIITLGNTIDFYIRKDKEDILAPKFISLDSEDINKKTLAYNRMSKSGAFLRMSTFQETKKYILDIYKSLRKTSVNLNILFTVSPVPLDNVIGIENLSKINALEMDCISKSTIRSALHELMISNIFLDDKKVYYLPSYEIIRWIAPMIGLPVFGIEDASSRHVSNIYLNTVCEFIYSQSIKL